MQNLMEGLSNALTNHGPVKVFADNHENANTYDQNLEEEKDHIHIISKSFEDDVIAYLQFKIIDEKLVKMQQVVVSQQHQSKGIGKELINFSENLMSTKGLNNILLHAREPVIGFYERLGYEKFGEKFLEVTIPHYKMKKRI